ncbi:chemotaxis protein CheA [Geobacter benzoatilyticus]|uniref:histidine kinase n=1 Tax=Geobacter benzoatilyticus TaxID=2815309 RepID=A0ABX7Q565_9BACT|nr:chemotaxis protein CheA [Geobacter benzoatilyticus]QSV46514.1 chemotaxis protein CheA [Geobacter benzoatilyticus]
MAIECEDQELLEGFLTETFELLEKLDDDLVALEKAPADTELMNSIFRSIHTVKGASSFLGFELLVKVTHKTEDVLNRMRRGELEVTPEIMDVILEAVDLVKLLVSDIKGGDIVEREIDETIGKLLPFLSENAKEATVLKQSPPAAATTPPVVDETPPAPQEPLETHTQESVETAAQPAPEPAPTPDTAPVKAPEAPPRAKTAPPPAPRDDKKGDDLSDNSTVRVDVKRLDDLMNQVGELVLERNRMMQLNTDFQGGDDTIFGEEFSKLSKRISFVTSELQMQVLKMRMIPVEKVFKKFPRIVRNMARDLGKDVDLVILGEETELDRSVVDEIGDPLIHLIRNAMDHGLETPDERVAAGKPRKGTLILSAAHEGNQIVISIKDDGKGINTDVVARKAKEKGLVTDEQLAAMGQRELMDLIFLPGFSTKEKATDLSGRGVGMDVVRTNIKKLNGIIDIRSELGQGSEFILKLPLTLAIIQSLLVEVEDETYSLPLAAVMETLRVDEREFHTIGDQEVLKLRDSVLPLMRLQKIFNVAPSSKSRTACYVVVVGVAEKRVGLVVSRLLGQQEVAIKSLGKYLANLPGIAGSTILGDGRVTLIIDPAGLLENSDGGGSGRMAA